jgi:hypothetical protein
VVGAEVYRNVRGGKPSVSSLFQSVVVQPLHSMTAVAGRRPALTILPRAKQPQMTAPQSGLLSRLLAVPVPSSIS